jgi:hypothetical protein
MSFAQLAVNFYKKMRGLLVLVTAVLLVTPYASLAKKFTRCQLAAELKKRGVRDLRNCEYVSRDDGFTDSTMNRVIHKAYQFHEIGL